MKRPHTTLHDLLHPSHVYLGKLTMLDISVCVRGVDCTSPCDAQLRHPKILFAWAMGEGEREKERERAGEWCKSFRVHTTEDEVRQWLAPYFQFWVFPQILGDVES